jgi:Na+-transporting methylmalonyl-CoA/oxaloacetate decarboxylase gamma subunit
MSNIFLALEITALGMGLVFATITLLWWVMNLLTFMTPDKNVSSLLAPVPEPFESATASHSEGAASVMDADLKARAAAVAVAVALAEQQVSLAHPLSDPPTAVVSPWQLGTRTRHLYEKGTPIVRKPRKIG